MLYTVFAVVISTNNEKWKMLFNYVIYDCRTNKNWNS